MAKKNYKVKLFKPEWLQDVLDGVQVKTWCVGEPTSRDRARCLVCPAPANSTTGYCSFSIGEGFSAIRAHSKTNKHLKAVEAEHSEPPAKQMRIEDGIRKQEEVTKAHRKEEENILRGQIILSNMLHSHGIPSTIFTCFAKQAHSIFPDSNLAKKWSGGRSGFRQTKGDYFGTHGIYPHQLQKTIDHCRENFFSVNFDETSLNGESQLAINVSFPVDGDMVKENLTTIDMKAGTSAQEIVDILVGKLEEYRIPLENIVFVSTDGCSVMLGPDNGVHTLLRRLLPHLPCWGGCTCHDCSNLLKAAFEKLAPGLVKLYQTWHSYLSSLSLHRKREHEAHCKDAGLEPTASPKHCATRFRMNIRSAEWMEKDDRCLYLCATKLRDDVDAGIKKDITEAEVIILKDFLGNYVMVRLSNMFFLDVSKPVLVLLNHLESEDPLIFKRWELMFDTFFDYLSKFLKDAGGDDISIKELLSIDFHDRALQHNNSNIFLGGRVETFLKDLGLNRNSIEVQPFIDNVRGFFEEALTRMVKYFKPSLQSRTLREIEIINPKSLFAFSLDEVKVKWAYVAKKFPIVVKASDIPDLLDQVSQMRIQRKVREASNELTPTEFYYELSKVQDKYPLVTKLALALLTAHNSSSSAERDISQMNSILADPRASSTKQLRLQTRLKLRSSVHNLRLKCEDCKKVKLEKMARKNSKEKDDDGDSDEEEETEEEEDVIKGEKARHCHCHLFRVEEDLVASMNNGQPWQRYNQDLKNKKAQNIEDKKIMEPLKKADEEKAKKDLKQELQRLRRKLQKEAREKSTQSKPKPKSDGEKKADRETRRKDIQKEREEKRKQCSLAFGL